MCLQGFISHLMSSVLWHVQGSQKQPATLRKTQTDLCPLANDHLPDWILLCWGQFSQGGQVPPLKSNECVHSLWTNNGTTCTVSGAQKQTVQCNWIQVSDNFQFFFYVCVTIFEWNLFPDDRQSCKLSRIVRVTLWTGLSFTGWKTTALVNFWVMQGNSPLKQSAIVLFL